jgi:hypothetical protein
MQLEFSGFRSFRTTVTINEWAFSIRSMGRSVVRYISQLLSLLFGIALAFPGSPSAADPNPPIPTWSSRDVFVFGRALVDFRAGIELLDRNGHELNNCSNREFYCAKSQNIHLVLPKRCAMVLPNASWSIAGVTTRVLFVDRSKIANIEAMSLLPSTIYVIGSDQQPSIVYLYTREHGVQSIYYDGATRRNLVRMAESGGIQALSDQLGSLQNYRYPLVTVDPFGLCDAPRHSN